MYVYKPAALSRKVIFSVISTCPWSRRQPDTTARSMAQGTQGQLEGVIRNLSAIRQLPAYPSLDTRGGMILTFAPRAAQPSWAIGSSSGPGGGTTHFFKSISSGDTLPTGLENLVLEMEHSTASRSLIKTIPNGLLRRTGRPYRYFIDFGAVVTGGQLQFGRAFFQPTITSGGVITWTASDFSETLFGDPMIKKNVYAEGRA